MKLRKILTSGIFSNPSQSFLWLQSLGLWVHSRWENMVQAEEPKLISICFELPLFLLVVQPGACGCTQGAPAGGTRWWCVGLDQEPGNLWQRTVASEPVQFLVTDSGPTPPHAVRGASVIQILYCVSMIVSDLYFIFSP